MPISYPVDLTTQSGDQLCPTGAGQNGNRGPYINGAGDLFIFSLAYPITVPRVISAYRSQDQGQTWHIVDGANSIITFHSGGSSTTQLVSPHPTKPNLVTGIYFTANTPPVVMAQDFDITTALWVGAPYGGAYPFSPPTGVKPDLYEVAIRPIAGEFVVFGNTGLAGESRLQFVRLTPGGVWGVSIDAFPGAVASDQIVLLGNLSAPSDNQIACTTNEHVYALARQYNGGGTVNNLIQCILSPLNVVTNQFIDFVDVIGGNLLGYYSGSGGYIAALTKIFLHLMFVPTVPVLADGYAVVGFAAQGSDIVAPWNMGTVTGPLGGLEYSSHFSFNQTLIYLWAQNSVNDGYYATINPTLVLPVVSTPAVLSNFFLGLQATYTVNDLGAGIMGAIGDNGSSLALFLIFLPFIIATSLRINAQTLAAIPLPARSVFN